MDADPRAFPAILTWLRRGKVAWVMLGMEMAMILMFDYMIVGTAVGAVVQVVQVVVQVVVPADSSLEAVLAEADYFGLVDMVGELNRRLEEQRREEVQRKSKDYKKYRWYSWEMDGEKDNSQNNRQNRLPRKLDEICLAIERKR